MWVHVYHISPDYHLAPAWLELCRVCDSHSITHLLQYLCKEAFVALMGHLQTSTSLFVYLFVWYSITMTSLIVSRLYNTKHSCVVNYQICGVKAYFSGYSTTPVCSLYQLVTHLGERGISSHHGLCSNFCLFLFSFILIKFAYFSFQCTYFSQLCSLENTITPSWRKKKVT